MWSALRVFICSHDGDLQRVVDCAGCTIHLGTREYRACDDLTAVHDRVRQHSVSSLDYLETTHRCAVTTERCRSPRYEEVKPKLTCSDVQMIDISQLSMTRAKHGTCEKIRDCAKDLGIRGSVEKPPL